MPGRQAFPVTFITDWSTSGWLFCIMQQHGEHGRQKIQMGVQDFKTVPTLLIIHQSLPTVANVPITIWNRTNRIFQQDFKLELSVITFPFIVTLIKIIILFNFKCTFWSLLGLQGSKEGLKSKLSLTVWYKVEVHAILEEPHFETLCQYVILIWMLALSEGSNQKTSEFGCYVYKDCLMPVHSSIVKLE